MIQLGTRWAFGTTPPSRLSPDFTGEIGRVEDTLRASDASPDVLTGAVWTLTWLEGRPTAELDYSADAEEVTVVTVDSAGSLVTRDSSDDDTDEAW